MVERDNAFNYLGVDGTSRESLMFQTLRAFEARLHRLTQRPAKGSKIGRFGIRQVDDTIFRDRQADLFTQLILFDQLYRMKAQLICAGLVLKNSISKPLHLGAIDPHPLVDDSDTIFIPSV